MAINLLGGQHFLRALGLGLDSMIDGLEDFREQTGGLQHLHDSFNMAAGFIGASMLANLLQNGGIPGAGSMPGPNAHNSNNGSNYAPPQGFDFGASPDGNPFSPWGMMNRMRGAGFERFLRGNPFARAQVEMMLGGKITPDGMADGRIKVQPFGTQGIPGGAAGRAALQALGMMNAMGHAATAAGMPPGMGNLFQHMMAGALANVLGAGANNGANTTSPFVDWAQRAGQAGGQPAIPGQGGANHPAQPKFGIEPGGNDEVSAVLNDPSLTVEDRVTLMIMLIMKKMDKDIQKQAEYINELQQQQGEGGKGGKGGKGGADGAPSIDVETMKLKRMIDKRSQMFDMLRQIIDKYNQTAKGIIDSIGR